MCVCNRACVCVCVHACVYVGRWVGEWLVMDGLTISRHIVFQCSVLVGGGGGGGLWGVGV